MRHPPLTISASASASTHIKMAGALYFICFDTFYSNLLGELCTSYGFVIFLAAILNAILNSGFSPTRIHGEF